MKRKLVFLLLLALAFPFILGGCSAKKAPEDKPASGAKENLENKLTNLKEEDIKEAFYSSQMTDPPTLDKKLGEDKYGDLLKKIKGYKIKSSLDEVSKGWEHLFKFELKDGSKLQISFSADKMVVDDKEYRIEGYNSQDFMYLTNE